MARATFSSLVFNVRHWPIVSLSALSYFNCSFHIGEMTSTSPKAEAVELEQVHAIDSESAGQSPSWSKDDEYLTRTGEKPVMKVGCTAPLGKRSRSDPNGAILALQLS